MVVAGIVWVGGVFSEMLCFAGVLYLIGLSWVWLGFGCCAAVCVGFGVGASLFWVGWLFTYLGFLFLLQGCCVLYWFVYC